MALIKCPECNQDVSDTIASCPHCGYVLNSEARMPNEEKRSAYDVMLVDYNCGSWRAKSALKQYLNCSNYEASNILSKLPTYLYTDISKDEADYIARMLQNCGLRIAVYDPNNNVSYYAPSNYNIPLPIFIPIIRRPWFSYYRPRRFFNMFHHQPRPMMPRPMGNMHMNRPMSNGIGGGMNSRGGGMRGGMPGGNRGGGMGHGGMAGHRGR